MSMRCFLALFTSVLFQSFAMAQPNIKAAEYFLGVLDPGNGNGVAFTVVDGAWDDVIESITSSVQANSNGISPTLINIRLKDDSNLWGPVFRKTIFHNSGLLPNRDFRVFYAEYFFGLFDPGEGQGTPILAFDGAFDEAIESVLRTDATWTVTNQPTLFNIRVKDSDNNWGPLFKKTIFPYGANPTAELIAEGDSLSVCPNSIVTLTYNGPNGYTPTWFNGFVGNSNSFAIVSPGYYQVSASLGNSTYLDSIYISFYTVPAPMLSYSGSVLVCASSVVTLSASVLPNTSYQWFYNNQVINNATNANFLPTQLGSYFVQTTNNLNGCARNSDTVTLLSAASISPSGSIVSCTSPVRLNAPLGTGNTYQWKLNGSNIPGATSGTYDASTSGSYSFTMTNGSCNSTSSPTIVTLTSSPPLPTITNSGSTTFCQGNSVVLNANAGSGLTYQWKNNGNNIVGATAATYTATTAGSYSVEVTNNSGCAAISVPTSVIVNVNPTATITSGGSTTFCQGDSVVLNANAGSGLTYQWKNNGNNIVGATAVTYTATTAGSYSVEVTNNSGCTAMSNSLAITIDPNFTTSPIIGPTIVIPNQIYSYFVSQNLGSTYNWQVINGALISGQGTNSAQIAWAIGLNNALKVLESRGTCIDSSFLHVATNVSVQEHIDEFYLSLYPNPSNGLITLVRSENFKGDGVFNIYDSKGRMVKSIQFEGQELIFHLDMKESADGVYLIRSSDSNWSTRFVIAKK